MTDSTTPEVLAAKERFKEILADKPMPMVTKKRSSSSTNLIYPGKLVLDKTGR